VIGASLGGMLAHHVSLAAKSLGRSPKSVIMIDPMPPIRPVSSPLRLGIGNAAGLLLGLAGVDPAAIDMSQWGDGNESLIFLELVTKMVSLGKLACTLDGVKDVYEYLRTTTRLLDLVEEYTHRTAQIQHHDGAIFLALATGREAHLTGIACLTAHEASLPVVRTYGNVVQEITLPYTHMDMCVECVTAGNAEFNNFVQQAVSVTEEPTGLE